MGRMQTTRRRVGRALLYGVMAWLLLWALLVVLAAVILPRIAWSPQAVGQWLGERAGMPVQVAGVRSHWTRRGPMLELQGLTLGQEQAVQVGRARLQLALYTGLLPGQALTQIQLDGLDLALRQQPDGRWQVEGLAPAGPGSGDPLDALSRLGEIQISGARLQVDAPALAIQRHIERVDLRLRVNGDRLRAGVRGWWDQDDAPLHAVVDMDRRQGTGRIWAGAKALNLASWKPLLQLDGATIAEGSGKAEVWLDMQHWRLQQARAVLALQQVRLRGAGAQTLHLPQAQMRANWQRQDDGWRLQVPQLRIGDEQMDGLQVVWGQKIQLQAPRLALGPWLQLLALSDQVPAPTRQWLRRANPQVELQQVHWQGATQGRWRGSAEHVQLGFAAVGGAPGLQGLAGRVEADEQGIEVALNPQRQIQLDWPTGFGVTHQLRLEGRIGIWPEQQDWRVATSALRVQGTDYGAWLRGGLRFHADGRLPRLDLAADLDDAPMTAAKRFWVRSKMSQGAIDWLDAALVGGHVRDGQGLVSGELADWPFVDNNGRFEARARIDDGVVHFAKGWHNLAQVDGEVAFAGPGFELTGRGRLGQVDVPAFSARIARFGQPDLQIRAQAQGQAEALLNLLQHSPLQREYGSSLHALSAQGPARVSFTLDHALGRGAAKVGGTVDLDAVRLADRRWDLQLDQVRGQAEYGNGGFAAPRLTARLQGAPVALSLRAGGYAEDTAHAFQARLEGPQDMADLLARAPELNWLSRYLQGRSQWQIGVDVLRDAGSAGRPMALLRLASDLEGTQMLLPAPLAKGRETRLPTQVVAPLPMGTGPVEIGFGQRLGLQVQSRAAGTAVLATLGSSQARGAVPDSGLMINGRTARLDALAWLGVARGGGGDGGAEPGDAGLALRGIDLHAEQLLLAGGQFAQTRLRLTPGNARIAVQLDGPTLDGQLVVPDAQGATVVGSLARLHWRADQAPAEPTVSSPGGTSGPGSAVDAPLNPASIPPLALDVADLKIGERGLGSALLRSRQLADGMQVDVLQLRSPGQAVDVQGSWRGTGAQARTRLSAQIDSRDFGALSGQQGQLRGGQGNAQLQAQWPGGPQDFALAHLQGQFQLDARNGQLLEVEPGAGRVLGLLSLAQLPRRMLFDFRDLFSRGLAFNQVTADVQFGQGVARTRKIAIDSSAAQIHIHGQADLAAQTFDQTVEVNPRAGNLLTVVGAVAGGPVGAAVGAAANAVLAKPLGGIGARTYQVTGPWKDPQVQVIERNSQRNAVSAPVAPAAEPATTRE